MEALRISPKYTGAHWKALDVTNPAHWPKAVRIVRDRLHGRFLHFADKCLKADYSGFVVLAIDCLLAEAPPAVHRWHPGRDRTIEGAQQEVP
jgi:hypothetical protein